MLNFVLAFLMLAVLFVLLAAFAVWTIREHIAAKKYRHLIRLHNELKKQPATPAALPTNKVLANRWEVTYKIGNEERTVIVSGKNEGAAVKEAMRQGVDYSSIVNFSKL